MAEGRADRRRAGGARVHPETPLSLPEITRQLYAEAMERWVDAWKGSTQEKAIRAYAEVAPIVGKYWSETLDRMWKLYSKLPEDRNLMTAQREFYLSSLVSLNSMMKEVMGTRAFAAMAGDTVEQFLKTKIASDRMMEEALRTLRIPTKADIDEVHSELSRLDKKLDALLVQNGAGPRRAAARERGR